MDNIKAEKYISKRLELMSEEKAMLTSKLDKIQLDMEEIDGSIAELLGNVDTAMEVFSPKPKKNELIKAEVENLQNQKDKLREHFTEFSKQSFFVEENIKELQDILGAASEENVTLENAEVVEDAVMSETEAASEVGAASEVEVVSEAEVVSEVEVASEVEKTSETCEAGLGILMQQQNEMNRIADNLDSVMQKLINVVHKCEMCIKIMDVDAVRSKLELENITKELKASVDDMNSII